MPAANGRTTGYLVASENILRWAGTLARLIVLTTRNRHACRHLVGRASGLFLTERGFAGGLFIAGSPKRGSHADSPLGEIILVEQFIILVLGQKYGKGLEYARMSPCIKIVPADDSARLDLAP